MKIEYTSPDMEIIKFETEDVVTLSPNDENLLPPIG